MAGLEAAYEARLMDRFLAGATAVPGLTLYGIASRNRLHARVPTFSFRLANRSPQEIAVALAGQNIFGWAGDFYAHEASGQLGLREKGGVARLGLSHYATAEEVDQAVEAVARLAA
ncbi:aminotransferase class V-fold PLP-dependent enzyme [Mesorhizobium sp. CO1-1-8]|uniref:aminotransferase class V-fold PLP-dependent enzyme n=1 Tax=Mesorhizobium sp. CO1-1-8 TaxID=2876631 RepID=UPI001CD0B086|nr:aminotransferase class V-fold PLP-dependent enzyme [Mesorhizobium sp. CO1-1-8]MBZ9772868.1 aminotransferase class V-fold PLP-dependent enzyme [Mesorhizobium sp. CO1-1-8]